MSTPLPLDQPRLGAFGKPSYFICEVRSSSAETFVVYEQDHAQGRRYLAVISLAQWNAMNETFPAFRREEDIYDRAEETLWTGPSVKGPDMVQLREPGLAAQALGEAKPDAGAES